jgi:primosomal protein N'
LTELYADLILELSNAKIDRVFTYRIPKELHTSVFVGCPVFVSFGTIKRKVKAYIIDLRDSIDFDKDKIKDILSIVDLDIPAGRNLLSLAIYMKKHYGVTFSKAISTVMPVKNKLKRKTQDSKSAFFNIEKQDNQDKILNEAQKLIYNSFCSDYDNNDFKTYLIHGITGSGKTLVYINMIKKVLSMGKQAIVLVPEISLTYQLVKNFISIFGDRVAILNSKLSKGERVKEFEKVLSHEADIIIGPRSALFTPFDNLGIIIIDEEHDNAYKSETVPRYDTRDLAVKLSQISKCSLVLASATPSPETYKKAIEGEYKLFKLKARANKNAILPKIHIVDLRKELENGNRSIFSNKLKELIEDRLNKKEQIILFMNRRGLSGFVSCRSCGYVIKCPHCDVSLTLHNNNKLYCHYCGYNTIMPSLCPSCKSPYIAGFGFGTQKLENMTKKMFPSARVLRLDQDTNKSKDDSINIMKNFSRGDADILIGTQMIVKGHDISNVTLVGIVAADASLYINDYTSAQRTYELVTQASGRAGRAEKAGEVVIQTYNPEHYALQACLQNDYNLYYDNEIIYRQLAMYPPIIHILGIQLSVKDEEVLEDVTTKYVSILVAKANKISGLNIIGPVRANIYKLRDYFRKIIYVKHSDYDILTKIKEDIEEELEDIKLFSSISIIYDLV